MNRWQRTILFATVAAAISLIVSFGCLALSANYNYCVGHNGQHYTGQYDQKGAPIVEPSIDNPSPVSLFVYCGGIYSNENGGGITALSTVLLTVVTVLLGYLAVEQGSTTRVQLRAYIVIKAVGLGTDGPDKPMVWVEVKNIGSTPALNVSSRSQVDIFPFSKERNLTDTFTIPDLPLTNPIYAMQPGESLSGPARPAEGRTFTPNELAEAAKGKNARMYVYGYATYTDAFGDNHETPFAASVNGGPGTVIWIKGGQWQPEDTPRFEMCRIARKLT
jgi:hypothetical protein